MSVPKKKSFKTLLKAILNLGKR